MVDGYFATNAAPPPARSADAAVPDAPPDGLPAVVHHRALEALARLQPPPVHDVVAVEVEVDHPVLAVEPPVSTQRPPERVRALRFRIRRRLLDADSPPSPPEREILLDDLDRVFSALQAHSYIGDYITVDPTLDRRAEMVMKLEEDLLGFPLYPVARSAHVTAGEPIAVSDLIAAGEIDDNGHQPAGSNALALESAGIAGKLAVATNDPVAGDDDGKTVTCIGVRDRADRAGNVTVACSAASAPRS